MLLLLLLLSVNFYLSRLKPYWDSTSLLQKGSGQEDGELHDVVIQYNTYSIKKSKKQTINRANNTEIPAQGKD